MRFLRFVPLLIASLALASCAHSISSGQPGAAGTPTFGQFTDVPIPDGARMDSSHTLLVGTADNWVGRLVFNVRFGSAPDLFDFYKSSLPKYQWQEISSTRSDISIMTWQRGGRVATIQIEETTFGVEVTINMGQAAGGGGAPPADSSAQPQPSQPMTAPQPPAVDQQPIK